jgi:2,3-bisphosphoglycerate-dependent phosphoglycerate mutase
MTHLYLIRHADYIYDLVKGKYPKKNQGLSEKGVAEAQRLRERLEASGEIKPDVFISSAERGAMETAEFLSPIFNTRIKKDKDFEEWRSEDGTLSSEEFMRRWNEVPKAQKPYFRWIEGCENRMEFSLRVHQALNRVITEHQGKTIAIVTHGAFIQLSFNFFFGYGEASIDRAVPEIRRTSITHWYQPADQERWVLERSNDCHHAVG